MKSLLSALLALSSATFALTGCTIGSFPGVSPVEPTAETSAVPIRGTVYGGHAPLVGAQVYILSPNQTTNYGLSKSVVCGDSPNTTCTASGTGNGLVSTNTGLNGYHFVTTDSTGAFNLTGDYNCGVNASIYLVAVGGSPTFPSASNVFQVNQEVVSNLQGTGANETATYTFTTTTTENFYIGEQVTLSNFTGNFAFLPASETVTVTNLTTTTFSITAIDNGGGIAAGTYTNTGTVTANPTNNPAAINMASLGLCPANNTYAGTISYIYMNEVSTAATAVALAAFGTDAFHIGAATGGTIDQVYPSYDKNGFKQGFENAKLLYDIQGSNTSTTYAGEGHIARSVTPAGNGIVPQALMDTWGNILAACVDSQNTGTTSTTASAQCNTLFATATSTGVACPVTGGVVSCPTGTGSPVAPTDIATAAFNMAHFPAGTNNTAFVNTLYTLPAGNVPFTPNLTSQPNDFSVALAFTAPASAGSTTNYINGPQVIAIDGGNYVGTEYGGSGTQEGVWIGNFYTQPAKLFASTGTPDYATMAGPDMQYAANARSMAIDYGGNVWMSLPNGPTIAEFSNTGAIGTTYAGTGAATATNSLDIALDGLGSGNSYNLYIPGYSANNMLKITNAGANVTASGGATNSAFSTATCLAQAATVALDPAGHVYSYDENTGNMCVIDTSTGAATYSQTGFTTTNVNGYNYGPSYIAVDGNSVVWGTNGNTNQLLGYTYGSTTLKTYTGGGMNVPCAVAVDGGNNIWVGNGATWSVSEFSNSGTALSPAANTGTYPNALGAFSPQLNSNLTLNGTTVFNPNGGVTDCANPAIDRAGDVWMAYQGKAAGVGVVFEILGIAKPAVSPTSVATFLAGPASNNSYLGQRPY